ncbi:hypothetical protein EY653_06160 [Enterococcus faecalis]|uniref:hypothetical protein n=1 Tax=Enterococcus faecalis TaxID=1351 RepID=UPI001AD6793C|nr:hypothetical protein [Enterococcus faecalis]MBO6440329.1 hypothetical protein [Enterococcus faecalis]MBO6453480.1 hypothetical protein [Enterococcus faecalis]
MRKPYMITYDLNSPGQRYDEVITTIKEELSTGAWCCYWKSSYLIKSDLTPNQMIDKLKPYIDKGDKFFIVEIVNNKQGWLTEKQWEYINNNIFN